MSVVTAPGELFQIIGSPLPDCRRTFSPGHLHLSVFALDLCFSNSTRTCGRARAPGGVPADPSPRTNKTSRVGLVSFERNGGPYGMSIELLG